MKTEEIAALGVVGYVLLNQASPVEGLSNALSSGFQTASKSYSQVISTLQLSVPQFTAYTNQSGNTFIGYTPAITGPLAASNNNLPDSWKCWLV